MKVHLIKEKTIRTYIEKHKGSKSAFEQWLSKIYLSDWNSPNDITQTFDTADLLGNGTSRVIFNIGGNNYRMLCKYAFGEKEFHLFICWIGTHAEYTKLCESNAQYTIWTH